MKLIIQEDTKSKFKFSSQNCQKWHNSYRTKISIEVERKLHLDRCEPVGPESRIECDVITFFFGKSFDFNSNFNILTNFEYDFKTVPFNVEFDFDFMNFFPKILNVFIRLLSSLLPSSRFQKFVKLVLAFFS